MSEHPILFSGPMIRAILDGAKTQTRRFINPQPDSGPGGEMVCLGSNEWAVSDGDLAGLWKCPYGTGGGVLWCRETWGVGTRPDPHTGWRDGIEYRADCAYLDDGDILPLYPVTPPDDIELDSYHPGWHPSIHMPRWACRLLLEVVGVRVERLHDITSEDIIREGISTTLREHDAEIHLLEQFSELWDSINGKKPGREWAASPWVWVIEFKRREVRP